jgi:hypothetical protein
LDRKEWEWTEKQVEREGGKRTGCMGRQYRLFQYKQYIEPDKAQLIFLWKS